PGADANPQPPELPQDPANPPADPAAPPALDANPTAPTTPATPPGSLVVPPDALQSGKMDFLNGQWAARMGVQDSQTGKPVQLQYQLKDGAGNVQIKRGDGVQCEAPVSASSEQGRLILNANSAAKCTDNAAYDMPKIVCDPGAAGAAAQCAGMYGSNAFPLILQQSE
ncbi:SrfA family protein, partial [Alcaligenes faecalis]